MINAKSAHTYSRKAMRLLGVPKTMVKLLKASDYSFTDRERRDVEQCVSLGIRIGRKAVAEKKKVYYVYLMWEWFVFLASDEIEVYERVEEALQCSSV